MIVVRLRHDRILAFNSLLKLNIKKTCLTKIWYSYSQSLRTN